MDRRKNLTKNGIIKGGFLRSTKLQKVDIARFDRSLDLRGDPKITATAADFQLSKIKDITIYPSYFKRDRDYKVEFNEVGQSVTITIIDIKKFMSEKIAIAIE
ncbi:MAG: hypothetical protein IH584_00405 [Candidatus Aminicenantes bacterium]|nr:hypothetical protein [Candidatus Aminicenantes bacterium]